MNISPKLDKIFRYKSPNVDVQEIIDRGYVGSILEKKKILFIGMNPSYLSDSKPDSFLYDVNQAVHDYPKHYLNFKKLIDNTDYSNNWTYIDLLYFRETNQKKLELILKNDIQFIVEQLMVTHEVIKFIEPKIIIIANSGASNFFGTNRIKNPDNSYTNIWFGLNLYFDKVTGLYRSKGINENSLLSNEDFNFYDDKYFLFTSTLKYMNKFEKERLSWFINKIS